MQHSLLQKKANVTTQRAVAHTTRRTNTPVPDDRSGITPAESLLQLKSSSQDPLRIKQLSGHPLQLAAEKQPQKNDTGLPDNLKAGLEAISGYSMDDVTVYYNSDKPAPLQALAYAQGTDIHLAPGQEQHLPHEAWHVVQQKQGRVQPTIQMKGGEVLNEDKGLEHEAEITGAKAGETIQSSEDNLPAGAKSSVIQRVYNNVTGHYDDRPKADAAFYPGAAGTQKAHKYSWDWIKQILNEALDKGPVDLPASKELFDKLVAFSGKPFVFSPTFDVELAKAPPITRSASFATEINNLAKQVCWTEWNIGRTPLPEERLTAAGGDDPGNLGLDLNYTDSGHTTPRSYEAENVLIKGGLSAVDPTELTNALNNLINKNGTAANKNDVLGYDAGKWALVGTRPKKKGGTLNTYRHKNNPNSWNGPFAELKFPKNNETITSGSYTIMVKVNNKTDNVHIQIQKINTSGDWVQARKDGDSWWFDWHNIENGTYEIFAKAFQADGRDWVSRKVIVNKV